MSQGSKFYSLRIDEIESKLNNLSDEKGIIRVWKKGDQQFHFRIKDKITVDGDLCLILFSEGSDIDVSICFTTIFYNFIYADIDYFGEGKVSPGEEEDTLQINFYDNVYRSEKRTHERLLTFPHHQVYVYYNLMANIDLENVVSLNQTIERNLKDDKLKKRTAILEKLQNEVDSNIDDLCGFRILDISRTGAAFLVDTSEADYFIEKAMGQCHLTFNDDIFNIPDAKIVYNVDYLSNSINKKKKIGISFTPQHNLTAAIIKTMNNDDQENVICKDFESFATKKQ